MSKQKKSSTGYVKGPPLERPQYQSPYGSPETLEHMKNCEAREWIKRYKIKVQDVGRVAARTWWLDACEDIAKRRGREAMLDLRRRMNENANRT